MFYLKTYLCGEARKAVEGLFYWNSEDAYKGAWKVLEERYGNPFIIQRAFREKLMKWPKVYDPASLQEFSDFLQGCVEAIQYVKGLSILNDCEDNYILLKKLSDWIVRNWNKIRLKNWTCLGTTQVLSYFQSFCKRNLRSSVILLPLHCWWALKFLTRDSPKELRLSILECKLRVQHKGYQKFNKSYNVLFAKVKRTTLLNVPSS